jgi:hypothetical protein
MPTSALPLNFVTKGLIWRSRQHAMQSLQKIEFLTDQVEVTPVILRRFLVILEAN